MIILQGDNIKILKLGYKTGHIEVVDLENDILYVGENISEVINEPGKPTKVKLYKYTAKPVEKEYVEDRMKSVKVWWL